MSTHSDNVLEVKILDRVYKIKCTAEEAHELRASAQYVDEQMRKVRQSGSVTNTDRVAVVTALNICHELLRLKQEQVKSQHAFMQRVSDLNERVKNSLATEEEITL